MSKPHSPTPWSLKTITVTKRDGTTEVAAWRILSADGRVVVHDVHTEEDARLIVAAVNLSTTAPDPKGRKPHV